MRSMKEQRLLALIPAKAASQRLRRKNALELDGEPVVARAIRGAREAGVFADIVVSTEDPAIAQIARAAGASVPFVRPHELSVDPAGVVEVTLHALDELEGAGQQFDTVVILLPTAPLRTAQDILESLRAYDESGANFLMSVSTYEHNPLAALIFKDGRLSPLLPDWLTRTGAKAVAQTPAIRRANGAVTICDVPALRRERTYYAYPLAAYDMPWERSIDIDTEADLAFAEFFLKRTKTRGPGR
ncbi:MAG: acylneuraminate cytidylyltransferase family protein [Vulcanimicrobiaceae bacterium]